MTKPDLITKTVAQSSAPQIELVHGNVMHLRLRPARHGFRYPLFYLRLPLRSLAQDPSLATRQRWFSLNRWNLLAHFERDHGDGQTANLDWLDNLLQQQGVDDADGEVWLQCFPRLLGYVFNPVSFYFCQRQDGSLACIVCEVNNTFGERHFYLLRNPQINSADAEFQTEKVFHVSPFCEVQGHYRFRFRQRLTGNGGSHYQAQIHYHDHHGPLILTQLHGRAEVLNDSRILSTLWRYPFMTLAVVWRIHWHALQLWLKRVPFFSKPLPPVNEVSQ